MKLTKLLNPKSVAVIGASNRSGSVGMRVFKNLLSAGFAGSVYPVNPKHREVQGHFCFASVEEIPSKVDLVVIATPAQTVESLIEACGRKGVGAAIIISAGFGETGDEGRQWEQAFLATARRYQMRLVGPNCLGIMRPSIKLNATFDNNFPLLGKMALVSQSGALCSAILDWAMDKKIGFSLVASLGNSLDLGFGGMLDFLAEDKETESILLYIEGIKDGLRFMKGLRSATKVKPVIVIKAGRYAQGSQAASTHTGALVGDDAVFDCAMHQAGAIRVITLDQLFSAAHLLGSHFRWQGNRLAVITNGGGAGVMAADRASELGLNLPMLSDASFSALNKVLPKEWSHQNPIDIIGDATPERYHQAIHICAQDEHVDAILALLVPVATSEPIKVAEQLIEDSKQTEKPILACWMGEHHAKSSWHLFLHQQMPYFETPESAIEAFSYLSNYKQAQAALSQASEEVVDPVPVDTVRAHWILNSVTDAGRTLLTTTESKEMLNAFLIPANQPIKAHSAEEALKAADLLGFPVVMKIDSPDITHKQEVGGIRLNLADDASVRQAFDEILKQAKACKPEAKISGVTLERMQKNPYDRELMIGIIRDKVFGPVISFGMGGALVEVMKDHALALPPLNHFLAKQMISHTRISKALGAFRGMPPVNLDAVVDVLLRVSDMVIAFPQIQEMDINPLIANDQEVVAVDARIVLRASNGK